jgi:hypothetical protein
MRCYQPPSPHSHTYISTSRCHSISRICRGHRPPMHSLNFSLSRSLLQPHTPPTPPHHVHQAHIHPLHRSLCCNQLGRDTPLTITHPTLGRHITSHQIKSHHTAATATAAVGTDNDNGAITTVASFVHKGGPLHVQRRQRSWRGYVRVSRPSRVRSAALLCTLRKADVVAARACWFCMHLDAAASPTARLISPFVQTR